MIGYLNIYNMSEQDNNNTIVQSTIGRTTPLSSTATLFWRLFVPVFSTVLLTVAALVFWLTPEDDLYLSYPALWARLGITAVLAGWIYFMYNTLTRLRRVDADDTHLYVTDYWKTARYPWSEVEKKTESKRLGRRIASFHLKGAGIFGSKISFLPAKHFSQWMSEKDRLTHNA
ncbi:MAG: hypothetical protein RIR11_2438 [Bacteroidota bacterium]|jgi:hypothetical protein